MILFRLHYVRDQLEHSATLYAFDLLDIPSKAAGWLRRCRAADPKVSYIGITDVRFCVDTREQFIQACLPLASLG